MEWILLMTAETVSTQVPEPSPWARGGKIPREQRLQYGSHMLQLGAWINGLLALLAFGLGLLTLRFEPELFSANINWMLARYDGEDAAFILVILFLLGNTCALMIAHASIKAREYWGLVTVWGIAIVNMALLVWLGFLPGVVTILTAGLAGLVLSRDIASFRFNPVMSKELRERMRGARAFVVITVYLGLMAGFSVLLYLIQRGVIRTSLSSTTGELGRSLFEGVFLVELMLIIFITPTFTAGAISNERERKTYDLLHITLLSKASFIMGKLEGALSFLLLLLLAAIPLQSIAFLFGGVGQSELILSFVILGTTAVALGSIGIYFSTTTERTITASARAYTLAAIVAVALPILLWFFVNFYNHAVGNTTTNITDNPVLETLCIYVGALIVGLNPILTASSTQQLLVNRQEMGLWTATLTNGDKIPMLPPWAMLVIIYLFISVFAVIRAIRRLEQADERGELYSEKLWGEGEPRTWRDWWNELRSPKKFAEQLLRRITRRPRRKAKD